LKNDALIGYGGLVHINWVDKHAEISFLIDTELEKDNFDEFWCEYIKLIEQIAFKELKLHKIYVYAFDLRPHLYLSLLKSNFFKDSQLKDHVLINGSFIDVVIHSKINSKL
jgi:RimJ/RimL family protein N-acetyltransferase